MGLPAVSISGATSGNLPLLSKRQAKLALGRVSQQINQSAVNARSAPSSANTVAGGADTIFAGTSSLLISVGGVNTLGASSQVIQFQTPGHGRRSGPAPSTPTVGAPTVGTYVGFAAAGNLTLVGGGYIAPSAAPSGPADSLAGGTQTIATVFGAAMAGSVLVLDPGQTQAGQIPAGQPPNTAVSVTGAAPDLLVGWSFAAPGYTVTLGGGTIMSSTPSHIGPDVQFIGLTKQGAMEIVFPKPG